LGKRHLFPLDYTNDSPLWLFLVLVIIYCSLHVTLGQKEEQHGGGHNSIVHLNFSLLENFSCQKAYSQKHTIWIWKYPSFGRT